MFSIIGEFGIVYKAHIVKHKDGHVVTETMAVKTLKGEPDDAPSLASQPFHKEGAGLPD